MRLAAVLAVLAAMLTVEAAADSRDHPEAHYDYFVVGDPSRPRAAHTDFALALMGGGGPIDAAFADLARHAGGGHIVILSAAAEAGVDPDAGRYGILFATRWGPVTSAQTLVFRDRDAAFDPRIIAALGGADGIFITGGDQANYLRFWKGTPVQQLLDAHVRAGRPIGGSSAGLAILGRYSYTAQDGGSLESRVALADPFDHGVTLEDDFLHFPWLENVITDSHFAERSRLGRLIVFVARIDGAHAGVDAYGVGVDERSALLIGADGVGRMAEGSAGGVWVVTPRRRPGVLAAGLPLTIAEVGVVRLGGGSRIDFKSRRITNPEAATVVSLKRGIAPPDRLVSTLMERPQAPY